MDDYAMSLFLAARRIIETKPDHAGKYLCHALRDMLETEGLPFREANPLEIFPSFAAAYDGKHFWDGMLIDDGSPRTIYNCWWYPAEDKIPRIAMIDFLVGR